MFTKIGTICVFLCLSISAKLSAQIEGSEENRNKLIEDSFQLNASNPVNTILLSNF